MPRQQRIDFPGAVHHVVNRGQNGRDIFIRPSDRRILLEALEMACLRHGCTLHTWALMPNHFHAVIRSDHGHLSKALRDAKSRYAQRINHREGWDGTLFSGRYFNRVVLDPRYLQAVLLYVTMNPERSTLGRRDAWTGRTRLAAGDALMREAFGSFDVYQEHEAAVLVDPSRLSLDLLPAAPRGPTTGIVGSSDANFSSVRKGLQLLAQRLHCSPGELIDPAQRRFSERKKLLTWFLVTRGDLTQREVGRVLGIAERTVSSRTTDIDAQVLAGTAAGRLALELATIEERRPTRPPVRTAASPGQLAGW